MDDRHQLITRVSDDGLTAWLIVPDGFDRAVLSAGVCDAALLAAGIEINAVTKQLVENFIQEASAAPPGKFEAVIARGTPPEHGEDGSIHWLIDDKPDTSEEPAETQDDNARDQDAEPVSFYDQSVYTVVSIGDTLATIYAPTPGVDGRDVRGKNLAAKDGKALEIQHDESIMMGKGNCLLAQASGVLDRSGTTLCIRDTIEVDRYVDFSTGNIDFNGSVVVRKGVRDCFRIEAEKDVEIHGLIEAATIIAGRDIRALGGFAGREQGIARTQANLHARYLDAVDVLTRGDLCIERELINCNTTVLGRINSPQGSLIGGDTRVAGSVEIAEIGAEGLPRTVLRVGVVPHLDPLVQELAALAERLAEERQKLLEEKELIERASGKNVVASHKERLCELMFEIAEVQSLLDRAEPSLESALNKAESMRSVDIRVHKRVYPNTIIDFGGLCYRIRDEISGPVRITRDGKGHLQIEKDGADPTLLARKSELSEAA